MCTKAPNKTLKPTFFAAKQVSFLSRVVKLILSHLIKYNYLPENYPNKPSLLPVLCETMSADFTAPCHILPHTAHLGKNFSTPS